MTDVPEHLLARSRERRAALGLGGDDAGASPAAPSAPAATSSGGGAAAAAPVPAAAAAAPAVVEEPVRPDPPYVAAAKARPRIPVYVAPVLAALPVFAFVYWGALTPKPAPLDPVLALGASVYADNCAGCHGANGEGGVGRPLDEVVTVFPDAAGHVDWVTKGSTGMAPGTPYGVGRTVKSDGYTSDMPGFAAVLSQEEIAAVVRYEREHFGGEAPPADAATASP